MAQTIRLKRSNVSGSIPTTANLSLGEIAINTRDGYAWTVRDTDGTGTNNEVVPILTEKTGANAVKDNVKAISASVTKGTPVTITGYDITNEIMEVQAANQATSFANAIMVDDVTLDNTGKAIMSGKLSGFDTSAWSEGEILYVGNGVLTNVEPTSGYSQPIGYVLRDHASLGEIQVQVQYPKQDAADVRYSNVVSGLTATNTQSAIDEVEGRLNTAEGKLSGIEDGATADQTAAEIEAIVSHDNLQGISANEHIDWTVDQGSTNIHAGNYVNTTYSIFTTTTDGLVPQTTTANTTDYLRRDGTWATPPTGTGAEDSLVTITAGTGLATGGTFTLNQATPATITLDLDLDELTTSTSNTDGDFFAVVDSAGAQKKLTKADIALSGFSNDSNWISSSSVTYETLNTNGDVGTGAGQLAIGNHNHSGVYEPADATILKDADIGVTIQGYNANTVVSSNSPAANEFLRRDGSNTSWVAVPITPSDIGAAEDSHNHDGVYELVDATILRESDIIDNLTSTSTVDPLSANQGKALSDAFTAHANGTLYHHSITDMGDVLTTMNPSNGQVLTYNTTNGWQAEDNTGAVAIATDTTTSTTPTDIALFTAANADGAELLISVVNNVTGNTQISKILITHDGTTAVATQYGDVYTSTALTTLDVNITTGTVNLNVTSASTNSTTYTIKINTI